MSSGYVYIGRRRAHRVIWEQHYGPIPKGWVVHHKDENRQNNDISNLEAMSRADHNTIHSKGRPVADWQKKITSESNKRRWEKMEYKPTKCIQCGGEFMSRSMGKVGSFCNQHCSAVWRANAFKPESRKCVKCGVDYIAKKRIQLYCSEACNQAMATIRYKQERMPVDISCARCGTVFKSKRSNARFCQQSCAKSFHAGHTKRRKITELPDV